MVDTRVTDRLRTLCDGACDADGPTLVAQHFREEWIDVDPPRSRSSASIFDHARRSARGTLDFCNRRSSIVLQFCS
jgi:hypothetical protein